MGRILSVDYGLKRCGIAATDPLQLIANGLTTVQPATRDSWLADYMRREPVERLVVGLPRQMNGQPSQTMPYIEKFVARFRQAHPDVPVDYCDERFTSVLAHQAILEGGVRKKARQNKALTDEVSATIILQSYLESRR